MPSDFQDESLAGREADRKSEAGLSEPHANIVNSN
jgi:hypothetical protein